MERVADSDKHGVVEMRNFLTSASQEDGGKSFLLKAMQEEYHKRTGIDIVTNQKAKVGLRI